MHYLEVFFQGDLQSIVKENPITIIPDKRSLKDIIEGSGVPHTEVGKIYFEKDEACLSMMIDKSGKLTVYPREPESIEGEVKFILDVHLGTLARYLRMMGFDTLYDNSYDDPEIVETALSQGRIILTRDRGILKRKSVRKGCLIKNDKPRLQLHEVLRRYSLYKRIEPLTRCFKCNGRINPVPKEEVAQFVPEKSKNAFHEFFLCEKCKMVYWKGSHYERFRHLIDEVNNSGKAR